MKNKKRTPPRPLIERIAEMLREDETISVQTGCFGDDSGCWIQVDPLNVPVDQKRFTSYSIQFDGKGKKMEGVRLFMNEVRVTIETNEIKP